MHLCSYNGPAPIMHCLAGYDWRSNLVHETLSEKYNLRSGHFRKHSQWDEHELDNVRSKILSKNEVTPPRKIGISV